MVHKEHAMIRSRAIFGGVVAVACSLVAATAQPASAQTLNVKLGLWEATIVSQTSGTPPFDTSTLTPEQKARMEAAMKTMLERAAQPHTMHTCLTKEKLDKLPFQDKNDNNCTNTIVTRTTSVYDVKFQCRDEKGEVTSGEWRFTALSPVSVAGNGTFDISRGGKVMTSKSTMTSKWLGASCGDVK